MTCRCDGWPSFCLDTQTLTTRECSTCSAILEAESGGRGEVPGHQMVDMMEHRFQATNLRGENIIELKRRDGFEFQNIDRLFMVSSSGPSCYCSSRMTDPLHTFLLFLGSIRSSSIHDPRAFRCTQVILQLEVPVVALSRPKAIYPFHCPSKSFYTGNCGFTFSRYGLSSRDWTRYLLIRW